MNENELLSQLDKLENEAQLIGTPDERDAQLSRIAHMKEYFGDDSIVSSLELEKIMDSEPPAKKVMSGWANLDALTEGFTYEQLIVLSAQEKSGKTAFALQLIERMQDENPCCFLFEQSPKEIIRQFKDQGRPIPFFYTPKSNTQNALKWIQERAMEAMVKHNSRVFVIDNFDWIEKSAGRNQTSEEVYRQILIDIKNFCKQFKVIVILIAHTVKLPVEQIPQPNDIKGSGAFKQIADTVLILWRKTQEQKIEGTKTKTHMRTNKTLVHVAENRRVGRNGYAQFTYNKEGRYVEDSWDSGLDATNSFDNWNQ
jgi:replicative DNA helicase